MDAPRTYRILRRAALHFAVAAWVASAAGAESPAALRTLLDSAMRNNPSIRAARARWEADEARVPQAGSLNDPQFRAMLMNSTGTPAMSLTPNDIQYRISLDVPFPGKRALRADMAREDAAISRHDIRRLELDIAQRIKDAYFDIHLAERKIEVNARNTERVRELLAAVRERYGTGRAELSDVLDLQNELAIRVNNESSFRDERRGAEIRLNLLRDMSASAPVPPPRLLDTGLPEVTQSADALTVLALEERPEIRQAEAATRQSSTALRLANAQYRPDFMVMLDRQPGIAPERGFDAMVTINLPFLFRKKYDFGIVEARAQQEAAEESRDAVELAIAGEVETALIRIKSSKRTSELYRDVLVPQAEDAYEAAITGYLAGTVDFVRLVDALVNVEEMRLTYFSSVTSYLKAIAELEKATASDLW